MHYILVVIWILLTMVILNYKQLLMTIYYLAYVIADITIFLVDQFGVRLFCGISAICHSEIHWHPFHWPVDDIFGQFICSTTINIKVQLSY